MLTKTHKQINKILDYPENKHITQFLSKKNRLNNL